MLTNYSTPVLRCCTIENVASHLPLSRQALLVENVEQTLPEGFALYLSKEGSNGTYTLLGEFLEAPDGCEEGSFAFVDEAGQVLLLETADRPDRTLFTTGLCNSNCVMCPYTEGYRRNSANESIETLFELVDLMSPDADYVCVTGGEPTLLRHDFLDLVGHIKSHFDAPLLHILTNGRTFAYADFANAFVRVRPYKTLLGIPLHASNGTLHDEISMARGSFEETIKGINNLYALGEHLEFRIVTSRLNMTNLPELSRFIVAHYPQCYHVCFMGLEMMGNAMRNRDVVWVSYQKLWPYVQEAVEILIANGIETQLYNYPLCIVDSRLQPLYTKSITPSKVEYFPECMNCARIDACGGFFRTTKVMPDIKVHPY